jgi:asparagine synthase (glutamine-hydrolysing)
MMPVYEKMQNALRRRGPDQRGITIEGGAALIHTRLAVIDIENGLQPMEIRRGEDRYILTYNGELYNTDELRGELRALGHEFKTRSDTEVLGRAYAEWGAACVPKFNGIFAFAVWDTARRHLFLARDRIGVKPLFYALRSKADSGDTLIFASELKALLCHPEVKPEIDRGGIAELLFIGPGRTPGCGVFKGVEELEPAHCALFTPRNDGRSSFRKWAYWSLTDRDNNDTFEQAAEKTRFLVTDAIERQLVSDVPICTFLSGGLDSSIISSVADRYLTAKGERLQTFTVSYRDNDKHFRAGKFQPNSDDEFVHYMNEHLNAEHHRVTLDTEELADALYEAVLARDLPGMADVDSSLLLFCREIKKHATVALSGECADEIFGGYPWYRDPEVRAREGFPWAQSTRWRKTFLRDEYEIDAEEYIASRYRATVEASHVLPDADAENRRTREMVNLNFKWFMQTLLDRKDRMSMYSGLEVRVPFCDWRIAEYLYTVPWAFKDRNNTEKGLLRAAMGDFLPEPVRNRKKSPYPKTHNPAYLNEVTKRLNAALDDDSPLLQIVKREALDTLLSRTDNTPWYGQLMTAPQTVAYFLQTDYWLREYNVSVVL